MGHSGTNGRREQPSPSHHRITLLAVLFAVATLAIVGRLAYLQVWAHPRYRLAAEDEHSGQELVPAHRGAILDRNGYPLATSIDTFEVRVDRRTWRDPQVAAAAAAQLAELLDMSPADLLAAVNPAAEGDYVLTDEMRYESGLELARAGIRGVKLQQSLARVYPEGDLASSLLGFIGRDLAGLTGIEADYERRVGGVPGEMLFERDNLGNPIALGLREIRPATPGNDLRLTIDRFLQRIVETELDRTIKEQAASGGAVVVMDPWTGGILALASRPSFRLSALNLNDARQANLYRNRAITDTYEPGSVFKVITMAAGIDSGAVTPDTTYEDTGAVVLGQWVIRNWDYSRHGTTTMTQVLQKSLNTGSSFVAFQLGAARFYQYVKAFGFGEPTGVDLQGEAPGAVRMPGDPTWSEVDLATNSFGQGLSATPIQVAAAIAAIANGGRLMRPYLVEEIIGPAGSKVTEPVVVREVVSPLAARTITRMMNEVVDGQYSPAQVPGYPASGKSGTAGIPVPNGYNASRSIATFAGFAPSDNPAVVVVVKIDGPRDEFGLTVAGPVFSRLMTQILPYLGVMPDGSALVEVPDAGD